MGRYPNISDHTSDIQPSNVVTYPIFAYDPTMIKMSMTKESKLILFFNIIAIIE